MSKISWQSLGDFEKKILVEICPQCQCRMHPYEYIEGWQKCGACGYTRENPIETNNPTDLNLITK